MERKMLQAVMTKPGEIEFNQVEKPTLQPDQIIMQTRRIGICGSDIHVYHGMHPYTDYPVIQGHEVSGVVAEVGENVAGLAVGEKITFIPQVTCGKCYPCRHGMYHICESLKVMGFQIGGAAQEYVALDAANVLKLPDDMLLDHAAMIEPISVAVHAIARGGGVDGKKVLVLGAGPIGNLTAQVARASGAAAVMITDISDYKLNKAKECGLEMAVNPNKDDLNETILNSFGPDRADLILECVGIQPTITQAVEYARKGTSIIIVGVFDQKPIVDLGLVQDRELSLVGTLMYQKSDYEQAIKLVAGEKMVLAPLISDHFPFEQYLDAYQKIEAAQGNIMKVMITLD